MSSITNQELISQLADERLMANIIDDGSLISESEDANNIYETYTYNHKFYRITWDKSDDSKSLEELTLANLTAAQVNAHIGDTINYTAPEDSDYSGDWKILYATNSEVFIITADLAEVNTPLAVSKTLSNNSTYNYVGSQDLSTNYAGHRNGSSAGYSYGSTWNSTWLSFLNSHSVTSEFSNAKIIAYLCDPDNWQKYVTGSASYAVGAPTFDLIEAVMRAKWGDSTYEARSRRDRTYWCRH